MDFRLLDDRIQAAPITAHLSQNGADRHCGHVAVPFRQLPSLRDVIELCYLHEIKILGAREGITGKPV
jgi:ferritin